MDAQALRRAFTSFFEQRGHSRVASASLIPHDPTILFTVAGMVPFKPYFLGDEQPPFPRATSVQKCVRVGGKHNDLEEIGRSPRHTSFLEMLGNFSFGDYFKDLAIPMAWELSTEVLGLDPDRLWVTVHVSDDEAEEIWRDAVGFPAARIQRLDEDNFWKMGDTGPCGPCSEIFWDKGAAHGSGGGPAHGGEDRYVEFWNLVFMQFNQRADGGREPLPKPSVDTGAGLERMLSILQGVDSVYDTDVLAPLVEQAQQVTGTVLGAGERSDVSLRILAEHARTMTFLVSDGVFPSNEDRGYVLRRIIRRAVRHAFLLGVDKVVTPELVDATVDVMGEAYPELAQNRDFVVGVVGREEERFRQTLRAGSSILDDELAAAGGRPLSGAVAFKLHDTFGFPLEVTEEVAAERGATVDRAGFDSAMVEQRTRGKESRKGAPAGAAVEAYRELVEQFGTSEFTGRAENETKARVLAVIGSEDGHVEVFLDRTPFYAESGGQVGDTGTITTETGRAEVLDTTYALPGLHRHTARLVEGEIRPGQEALAGIDVDRRQAIRRNHTGTHLLHWALREVLGDHVKQQGSLVGPEYLRFDFSHYAPASPQELATVEDLANAEVLANDRVRHYETTKAQAAEAGAIAFFGDKYGDIVRVLEAGR
ncbi:MAG: alanine--tRNA ligase, partial [Actinomycetota bacterium]|nr:alanine--tRNA ligase [Actinomycetota bacterium]